MSCCCSCSCSHNSCGCSSRCCSSSCCSCNCCCSHNFSHHHRCHAPANYFFGCCPSCECEGACHSSAESDKSKETNTGSDE
ncbi:hypothetical protein MHSWG343_08670 [Candidatus Mycoplasma haematohominis]|uniref:Uncharacterized protein n=1 Tax=Candidatus Mycoplasma haematohominis TaxID=1494318 RepID=A0A478FUY7_9MOLU|nr:hypothetical protein MHSWG343_08670 [Candidatus Mycoplasma haemohominis]